MIIRTIAVLSGILMLSACSLLDEKGDTSSFPIPQEDQIQQRVGKVGGQDGLVSFGGADKKEEGGNNPLGVNSFLWRATLDTVSFMPLASADPFGGVIITDWYEDPTTPGERFKINALILDRSLRADSIRASVFKQRKNPQNIWQDIAVPESISRQLEDAILTRARQLRVAQMGY